MRKKSVAYILGRPGLSLPGTGNGGSGSSHPSYSTFLHGHGVLLCEKLQKAS